MKIKKIKINLQENNKKSYNILILKLLQEEQVKILTQGEI